MSSTSGYVNSDDVIQYLIREIVHRASAIKQAQELKNNTAYSNEDLARDHVQTDVTETLAAFIIRATIVDPSFGFDVEHEFTKSEVERLITTCVNQLVKTDSPRMETIRMQIHFDTTLPVQGDYLRKEKLAQNGAVAPLIREIVDSNSKKLDSIDELYRKIVTFIINKSGLGSATNISVVKETTAALESTFPNSEVSTFISLPRHEKESQLLGLTQLVTGIRLFNKDLGKGGEGITNLPQTCLEELQSAKETIQQLQDENKQMIQEHTAVYRFSVQNPDTLSPDLLSRLKISLVFRRQFLLYLDTLLEQFTLSEKSLEATRKKYDDTLRELKTTCRSKTAVPVDQVYPLFMVLSNCWTAWKDDLFLLFFRRNILNTMLRYAANFTIVIPATIIESSQPLLQPLSPVAQSEVEIITRSADLMSSIAVYNKKIEVLHPGNSSMYHRLNIEMGGYCPYTVAVNHGFLLPGTKNVGVLRYKDLLYTFANAESALEFAKDPDGVLSEVIEVARTCPELIQILNLHSYFPTVSALENARSYAKQKLLGHAPILFDAGTQCETHIVDSHLDPSYQWNEWHLRRQGILYVNLRKKQTRVCQTEKSAYRRESESQHYEWKEVATQTKREDETQVPKMRVYWQGVRHAPGSKAPLKRVDLTLDL